MLIRLLSTPSVLKLRLPVLTQMPARFVALLVALLSLSGTGRAIESAKIELHTFATLTLSDEQFLTGRRDGAATVIAGELRIPRPGADRLPAMIIVHGSGGIMGNEDRWSRELNDLGIATFTLDGFTPRGIISAAADQSQLGNLTMINDAYRGLELLAKHPRIDGQRIGIMGGSRGGRVALYASLRRFQRAYAPAGLEFAIYLAFYTPCYATYIDDENVSDRPIRLFHGSADDYVPVAPCRRYVERLRRRGKDVVLTEYSRAYHLFDNPVYPLVRRADLQTARQCTLEEKAPGNVVNVETGGLFTWDDPCVERGAMVGYDGEAHSETIKAVATLLRSAFNLQ